MPFHNRENFHLNTNPSLITDWTSRWIEMTCPLSCRCISENCSRSCKAFLNKNVFSINFGSVLGSPAFPAWRKSTRIPSGFRNANNFSEFEADLFLSPAALNDKSHVVRSLNDTANFLYVGLSKWIYFQWLFVDCMKFKDVCLQLHTNIWCRLI